MQLKGKTALVTGGAMGVGLGSVQALADRGVKVVSLDVAEDAGQQAAAAINAKHGAGTCTFLKCDVTNGKQLEECFKKAVSVLGNIDIVFNNAGLVMENRWEYMLDVNIKGVVLGTQLAVAHMRRDQGGKGGAVINTSSMVGMVPRFVFPVYAASKHAVHGFTASWARNPYLKDMGVRFSTLCPTAVDTAFQKFKDEQLLYPAEFKTMLSNIGMLPVEKVVEGFLQLAEDDDSNGANLTVTVNGNGYKQQAMQDAKALLPQ